MEETIDTPRRAGGPRAQQTAKLYFFHNVTSTPMLASDDRNRMMRLIKNALDLTLVSIISLVKEAGTGREARHTLRWRYHDGVRIRRWFTDTPFLMILPWLWGSSISRSTCSILPSPKCAIASWPEQ